MTEEVKPEVEKPSDRLTINVNGKDQEIFMSGGLIRNIVPYYMSSMTTIEIFTEFTLQSEIIAECVKPRNNHGQPKKEYTIDDFEISREDANKLIAWVTEHVLYFFIDNINLTQKVQDRNTPQIQKLMKLMQSPTGSQDSQEVNVSAGPSM